MTKRTKPKATPTVALTINSTAPTSSVGNVKTESKARVATKPKQANSTATKAPSKPRARSKKQKDTFVYEEFPDQTLKQNLVANVLYEQPTVVGQLPEPKPSKYEQFKAWLVFKLYHYTSYFRGY